MAFLLIMSGHMKGQRFEIEKDGITIGRAPDNTISLDIPAVSTRHCSILCDGENYNIRDLDSTNGTRLNGQVISESQLKRKDIIMIGSVEIMFNGTNVEADNPDPASPSIFKVSETADDSHQAPTVEAAPVFGVRHDSRAVWITIIAITGLFALAALAWFLFNLFKK